MSDTSTRPLVSLLLCAFRQERFIRAAVEAAFAQTYSPLEIILSDDCSPDRTFTIMEEMAAAYRGPHRIVLNRNEQNRGLGDHINRMVELSHGELLVTAAGDDISHPRRVEMLVGHWQRRATPAHSIYSDARIIDQGGQLTEGIASLIGPRHAGDLQEAARSTRVRVPGCTHAFRREIFTVFGPLPVDITNEDEALAFRSLLLGAIQHVPEPLIDYRRHEQNISGRSGYSWTSTRVREEYRARIVRDLSISGSWLRDIRLALDRGLRPASELDAAEEAIRSHVAYLEMELSLVKVGVVRALVEMLRLGCGGMGRKAALQAFIRTQVPMSLRTLRARTFGAGKHRTPAA